MVDRDGSSDERRPWPVPSPVCPTPIVFRPLTPRAPGARFAVAALAAAAGLAAAALPAGAALPGATGDIAFSGAPTDPERAITPGAGLVMRGRPGAADAAPVGAGSSPAWSPDGTELVLVRDGGLVTLAADGSTVRPLPITGATNLAHPRWSPDGETIVFTGYPAQGSRLPDVYTAAADGSDLRDLTESERTIEADPTWSPDGRTIFYAATVLPADGIPGSTTADPSGSPEGSSTLRSMSPDGSGVATVEGTHDAKGPDVSPDGRFVLFSTPDAVLAYDRSTGAIRWVIGAAGLSDPEFSPDCREVGFTRAAGASGTSTRLESLNLETGAVSPLTPSIAGSAELAWQRLPGPTADCTLPGRADAPLPTDGPLPTDEPPRTNAPTPLNDRVSPPTPSAPRTPSGAPADTTPPALSIGATSKQLSLARRHGVRVAYRVNERVRIRADVMLTSLATAPALTYATAPAAGPGRALASADVTRLPGDNALRIQFNYRALKVLRPFIKLTVNVRLIATDAAGNETTAVRRVVLRKPF